MENRETAQPNFEKPINDYLRVMTATPDVAIADVSANVQSILTCYETAKQEEAELLALPELCITSYSAADLFNNDHVLEQAEKGLTKLAEATKDGPVMVVGAPLSHNNMLYNCAAVLAEGEIKGVVPKIHLPNYGEFYDMRWFNSGKNVQGQELKIGEQTVPFGTDLLFEVNNTKVGVEVCEDAWAPLPPSTFAAMAGAEVIVNISASNELIGKTDYRRKIVAGLAGRLICGYVYAGAGKGESNADVVYGGHQMISEIGRINQERQPHDMYNRHLVYDLDRTHIAHDRRANKTFSGQAADYQADLKYRVVAAKVPQPEGNDLKRTVDQFPFVPRNPEKLDQRCEEIFTNLTEAFAQRLDQKNTKAAVLGLSGGLDSTIALLIADQVRMRLIKSDFSIHTITMPGPGSSSRTQENANKLANALATQHKIMPIDILTDELLDTIGHDRKTEDIAYENTQARIRTNILMNYANMVGGAVMGTGDMSENMLGWCTYNGDHMSMYNPNAQIPKTLVSHLVQWYKDNRADKLTKEVLTDILDTPISPELTGQGELTQTTEDIIGPYALHDFFTYHLLRYGSRPQKIGYLATQAFNHRPKEDIDKWLTVFLDRFTGSQWKREAMPNGTKTGTVANSPRGDLRMAPETAPEWWKTAGLV